MDNTNNMKNIKKAWINSLSFLDNCYVNAIIVIILVLYSSTIFDNINSFIGNLYNFSIIRLLVLVLIIYVGGKDTTIAILLGISYLVSIKYMEKSENFEQDGSNKKSIEGFFPVGNNDSSNFDLKLSTFGNNNSNSSLPNFGGNNTTESNSSNFNMMLPNVGGGNAPNNSNHFNMKLPNVGGSNSPSNDGFNMALPNYENNATKKVPTKMSYSTEECLQNYTAKNEVVGDVCSPTSTFKNEFNAQGLNFPEGFDDQVVGSPL